MGKRSSAHARLGALAWCIAIGASAAGCEAIGHLAPGQSSSASATSSGTGGTSGAGSTSGTGGISISEGTGGGPPAVDAGGYCGNQIHQVVTDPPNLYFVFDVSGSMGDIIENGFTKYELVEQGAVQMIENLGPLINVGAAIFPAGATSADQCQVGAGVFPISPGDPIAPTTGPTTEGFIVATSVTPFGGTPTAATLTVLRPELLQVPGRTVVILATDGGPNCDAAISCGADQCGNNIEGTCDPPGVNCCAPGGSVGPDGCVDQEATVAAIGALASAGIPVYVIGVPGSEFYASVLDAMAVAGGEPQAGEPAYYDVTDLTGLSQLFGTIAAAYVSCDFTLEDPPADEDHTNVYFDGTVVLADPVNGWIWVSPSEIELVGAACAELKSGKVIDVQIVSGCPTQMQM